MSGPNLPHLPPQSQSILPTGKVSAVNIRPNASLTNIPQAAVDAFASSARQGPLRGQVVRENKDSSYDVRTKDGEVQIKPESTKNLAGTSATPAPHFKAGDPVQLDFPVEALKENGFSAKGSIDVQISLLNSTALLEDGVQIPIRASDTPLRVEVNAAPPQGLGAPISAQLIPIPVEILADTLAANTQTTLINQTTQSIDIKSKIFIDTAQIEMLPAPITTQSSAAPARIGDSVLVIPDNKAVQTQVQINPPPNGVRGNTGAAVNNRANVVAQSSVLPSMPFQNIVARSAAGAAPTDGGIRTVPQETASKTVQTHQFNVLPQTVQQGMVMLHAPNDTVPSSPAPAHRAGHAVAQVMGFSKTGAPIVTVRREGDMPPAPHAAPSAAVSQVGVPAAVGVDRVEGGVSAPTPQHYLLQTSQLSAQNLSVGTQIEIVPQSIPQSGAGVGTAIVDASVLPNPTAFFLAPGAWPVMTELAQTLATASPTAAQVLGNITPSPSSTGAPAQIMPAAMLFIAAMRGGDMQSWMGNKMVETLRSAGKGDLLSRLSGEGQALGRMGTEPLSQDWRAMTLPFLEHGEMQKVALYYKHDEHDDGDGETAKQTRFVFDLSLSQMGKVQVDGLFCGKKLDLVVRTADHFSPDMRQRMRGAYTDALEVSGLSGELSFQNGEEAYFSVAPQVGEFEGRV